MVTVLGPDRAAVLQRRQRLRHRRVARSRPPTRCSSVGTADIAWWSASTSTRRARSTRNPGLGPRRLVRRDRPDADDAVLRDEDPALHARPRHRESTLALVAAKAYATARSTRTRGGARRCPRRRCSPRTMVNHPLTQYMFCSPGEGAVALVLARGRARESLRPHADLPALGRASGRAASARSRSSARRSRSSARRADDRGGDGRVRAGRASGPRTSTSPSSRTPSPAPRSCTWPRRACAGTASRRR